MTVDLERRPEVNSDNYSRFLDAIGRPGLKEVITRKTPWVSASMEVAYAQMPFTGGMGILTGDELHQAEKLGIPFVVSTLAYSQRWRQRLEGFYQKEDYEALTPEDLGLVIRKDLGQVEIRVNDESVHLDICQKQVGNGSIVALYEEGLRDLYYGSNESQHRLYQEVVLGFGGHEALKRLELSPAILHLNESAKVFSAVAFLDEAVSSGMTFEEALDHTRRHVVFTNHTLVPAAVSSFAKDLFEKYVFGNIKNQQVNEWIAQMIDKAPDGKLSLSTLALELSRRTNGVSQMHSKIASSQFRRINGDPVYFEPITNGIFMERWVGEGLYGLYKSTGIIDEFDLPGEDYQERIEGLDIDELGRLKSDAKSRLVQYLSGRVDQDGNSVRISADAKIAVWARRLAGYKRPGMLFEQPGELMRILESNNMHLIISGRAHPTDKPMKDELKRILHRINDYPALRERVHFVQDYDEELAEHLVTGVDIWINTPEVGKEACGTSGWKAFGALCLGVSTMDGGLADIYPPVYRVVKGVDYQDEVDSLYFNLSEAAAEVNNPFKRFQRAKAQLAAYLEIISGGRMLKDYLNFAFPLKSLN